MSRNKIILIAVALPFIVLCLLVVRAEYNIRNGEQWSFEITGYDPRDLLRGHYLQFNLKYNWQDNKNNCKTNQDCCLCLTENSSAYPDVHKTACDIARQQCDGYMLMDSDNVLKRFYIPEDSAKTAEKLLRNARSQQQAYLSVSINKKGQPTIIDLFINQQSISEILKMQQEDWPENRQENRQENRPENRQGE